MRAVDQSQGKQPKTRFISSLCLGVISAQTNDAKWMEKKTHVCGPYAFAYTNEKGLQKNMPET